MRKDSVETLVRGLESAGVRYLIAGGLAVVAHGYVRFTADVDLLLDLDSENLHRALAVLASMGYRPRAPVALAEFADPETRNRWAREKGLTVFSLFSSDHSETEIDVFVESPIPFADAWRASVRQEIAPGVACRFVGLDDLLAMKRVAGRSVDRVDIEELERLREGRADDAV